jgi:hypothetical protein
MLIILSHLLKQGLKWSQYTRDRISHKARVLDCRLSPNPANNVTENQCSAAETIAGGAIGYNSVMEPTKGTRSKAESRMFNFGGKNFRFYASALTMLLLILVPFGLYAALNHGNDILAGILFAIIAGCMLVMLLVA